VIDNTTEIQSIDELDMSIKTSDFAFLGRLTAIKRPIDAVLAFSHIISDIPPDSKLHIIGNAQDNRYVEKLKSTILQHHLDKRVILHGHMSHDELSRILRTSCALLVPSEKE